MSVPTLFAPQRTYFDPELWPRLMPRLAERQQELTARLVSGRWNTEVEARQIVGQLQAFKWLLDEADDLTKLESE